MNRLQHRRSSNAGVVPNLAQMLEGEIAINTADKAVFFSSGIEVVQLNHLKNQVGDSTHRTVADSQIAQWTGKQDAIGYTPLNIAGDTMQGPLVLAGAPEQSGHAATKAYVDQAVSAVSGTYQAPVQTVVELASKASTTLEDKHLCLVEDEGALYRYDAQSLAPSDGTGVILPDDLLEENEGRWFRIQSATSTHEALSGLQGGAPGDHQHLTTAEKNAITTHYSDVALHLTVEQNAWLDGIVATSDELNFMFGVTSNVQEQLDGKQTSLGYAPVSKAGDTMTGPLILSEAPSTDLGAATKKYADDVSVVARDAAVATAAQYTDTQFAAMPYDLTASFYGMPAQDQEIARIVMARAGSFGIDFGDSIAKCRVTAAAGLTLELRLNGVAVGTAVFDAVSDTATFTAAIATAFVRGDVLTVVATGTADAQLEDVAMTLSASLG